MLVFVSTFTMKIIAALVLYLVGAVVAGPLDTTVFQHPNQFNERIVGGSPAQRREFPYQVSYQIDTTHHCGGSILTESWILTAAHCLVGTASGRVVAGITNLGETHQDVQVRNIQQEIGHPLYPGGSDVHPYDIALLLLEQPLQFTAAVKPISVPRPNSHPSGMVVLPGWGYLNSNNPVASTALQNIRMNIISTEECKSKVEHPSDVEDTMVCVVGSNAGACNGDSGGPMAQNGVVVGVASWVETPCGSSVSVYTKVSSFLPWIRQYVQV